jgi:hypothetical protein
MIAEARSNMTQCHSEGLSLALTNGQGEPARAGAQQGMTSIISSNLPAQARLDLPPDPAARIMLPAPFSPRFAIFADAEEEFDWHGPFRRDATSTETMAALPEANARFVTAGCIPTHLVDWPVVNNPASAAIVRALLDDGACAIGTQLHPWVNPPFEEDVSRHNSYLGNLPRQLQAAKLIALTEKIELALGVRPRIYRAGRYGIGEHTADLLDEAGYRLDVSVRSRFYYRDQAGPDFSKHPLWPWRVTPRLAELPLTTIFTGPLRRWPSLHGNSVWNSLLSRGGMLDRVPLTPEGVPLNAAIAAIDQALEDGHQIFSLSFHTPTLVPGHTPYVRDASDLRIFWAWWDGVFAHFNRRGVTGISGPAIIDLLDGIA